MTNFVPSLTDIEIIEFIEETFGVKVKSIKTSEIDNFKRECVFTLKGGILKHKFQYSDHHFLFPIQKSNIIFTQNEVNNLWQQYLYRIFGERYAKFLNLYLESNLRETTKNFKNKLNLYTSVISDSNKACKRKIAELECSIESKLEDCLPSEEQIIIEENELKIKQLNLLAMKKEKLYQDKIKALKQEYAETKKIIESSMIKLEEREK